MGTSWHRNIWAENLKAARQMDGKTQQELADTVGTSQAQISLWESGRSPIGVEWLAPLAEALGVLPLTLFPIPGVAETSSDACAGNDGEAA